MNVGGMYQFNQGISSFRKIGWLFFIIQYLFGGVNRFVLFCYEKKAKSEKGKAAGSLDRAIWRFLSITVDTKRYLCYTVL